MEVCKMDAISRNVRNGTYTLSSLVLRENAVLGYAPTNIGQPIRLVRPNTATRPGSVNAGTGPSHYEPALARTHHCVAALLSSYDDSVTPATARECRLDGVMIASILPDERVDPAP